MMALTDGQDTTKQAIVDAVAAKLEELNEALIATLPDAWPEESPGPESAVGDVCTQSLLALIADDFRADPHRLALVADDEPADGAGRHQRTDDPPVLWRALTRLGTQIAAWGTRWPEICEGFDASYADLASAFQRAVGGPGGAGRRVSETAAATPVTVTPADTGCAQPASFGADHPFYRPYWDKFSCRLGSTPVAAIPASQPSAAGTTGTDDTIGAPLDVTETSGPIEYDPYRDLGSFGEDFARDEEQFRY